MAQCMGQQNKNAILNKSNSVFDCTYTAPAGAGLVRVASCQHLTDLKSYRWDKLHSSPGGGVTHLWGPRASFASSWACKRRAMSISAFMAASSS